jgi:hypothetical protein
MNPAFHKHIIYQAEYQFKIFIFHLNLFPGPEVAGNCILYSTDDVVYTPPESRNRLHQKSMVDQQWVYGKGKVSLR